MAVGTLTVNASSTGNSDDYRTWTHRDSRWGSTTMGTTTLSNGGAPTTAVTKLAVQAGLRDAHDFDIGDMSTLLTANSGYDSSNRLVWNTLTKPSLNLFSKCDSYSGGTSSSAYSTLIGYINSGYHLVLQVPYTTSSGTTGTNYVAVDEKLSLAKGAIYIMDCYTTPASNINVLLKNRYSTFSRVIAYKGDGSKNSSIDSDYRKWELNNTNWASTTLGTSGKTMNNSVVGGGDLVLASTKLAIQAGTWSKDTEGGVNSVNRAAAAIANYTSKGIVNDWDDIKTQLGFQSYNNALMGSASNTTATMNTSLDANVTEIIDKLNEGYYLAIRINSSVGWVAVDTEKTLSTGEIYIMRSTPDGAKNADVKLADYYDTMNRVAGFKAEGVQINLKGNASFTASYTKGGSTSSFASGAYVPDGAVVTITATPNAGYTAANSWAFTANTFSASSSTATTCTFTANKSTATATTVTYTPTAQNFDISYTYGTNATSANFDYTTVPDNANTGATVELEISPKATSFAYELKITALDADDNEIPVTHNGTRYTFTMPASDVSVTFEGRNIEDWRRWARDDERWRDYPMTTNGHTVKSDGAVMISLAKMVVQAGVQPPTTLTTDGYDPTDVVDAMNARSLIVQADAKLTFNDTTAAALGFDDFDSIISTDANNESYNLYSSGTARKDLVTQLKQGYHQIIRLFGNAGTNADSEWFIIDEEKTLAAAGKKVDDNGAVALSDIYIYRATADSNVNASYNLQQLYTAKGYKYIHRNYAFLGGTTPSRKINFTIYKQGTDTTVTTHQGEVEAEYTIDNVITSFVSGAYVPTRSDVSLKYVPDSGYYSFADWKRMTDSVSSLSATETDNPKIFTINPSEFRPSSGSGASAIVNSTLLNIRCEVTPDEYNIYYEDGSHFSYANNDDTAAYTSEASFDIDPDNGYEINSVTLTDSDGNSLGITPTPSGDTYTFTMPAADVYVSATAAKQSYDDFRKWGIGDTRWKNSSLRNSQSYARIGTATTGGTLFIALSKLLIQSGWSNSGTYKIAYDPTNSTANGTAITTVASNVNSGNNSVYALVKDTGAVNNEANNTYDGWGIFGYKMGIIASYASDYYDRLGTKRASTENKDDNKYVYPQLLNSSSYSVSSSSVKNLIKDYLLGTNDVNSGFSSTNYNTRHCKFNLLIYVNSTYGWVAVDEAQTLNTGEIWVWASHGRTTNDVSGDDNIVQLSTLSSTFERVAAFKLGNNYSHFGADKVKLDAKLSGASTDKASLSATYTYLGEEYGPFTSDFYAPHGAVVTVNRASINNGYTAAETVSTGEYQSAPWDSSVVATNNSNTDTESMTDAARNITSDDTSFEFTTKGDHDALKARPEYTVNYNIAAIPKPMVHLKFLGDAHGTLYGAGTTLSEEAIYYEDDSIVIAPIPDENYEVDKILIKKTDSTFSSVTSTTEEDANIDLYTFDSSVTGGAESYFIVQATFKRIGIPLEITYNYKEYNPSAAGTHEYQEGAGYLVNKSYVKTLDSYDTTVANPIQTAVTANVPALHNNYFDYSVAQVTSNTTGDEHTATVTLNQTVHHYTITVNGESIGNSYHYQEEITLDAEDYDVDFDDVVWARGAESGKSGSADVCYNKVYSFRVTSDLNLTVGENLSSRTSADGTSAVTPGYTELSRVSGVEKCHQNFYIQDFYNTIEPTVYDTNGDAIEGASGITFLGAGVLFYAYDTSANQPTKSTLRETYKNNTNKEPTRSDIYSVLNNNKNAFLSEATGQGKSFKSSNFNYSYINADSDNGSILRYSTATDSYNYFFTASIDNDRTAENQKYVYRVYSFYVCSYTLGGNTYVSPILSNNYAQAKLYSTAA